MFNSQIVTHESTKNLCDACVVGVYQDGTTTYPEYDEALCSSMAALSWNRVWGQVMFA